MKLLKRIVNKLTQLILNKPNDSSSNIIKSDSISYGGVNYRRKITKLFYITNVFTLNLNLDKSFAIQNSKRNQYLFK